MKSDTVKFCFPEEQQMKAVAVLIQKASRFASRIHLYRGERRANAKSLLGVMSLGVENGMELRVTAEGDDEVEAIAGLVQYLSHPEQS